MKLGVSNINPSSQVSKASAALIKHIASSKPQKSEVASSETKKRNLLADEDAASDSENEEEDTPVWLLLTTKKHIVDKNRLKPTKIPIPNSLHTNVSERILLITAEPQRAYKDIVAAPAFPAHLRNRIARVIDMGKLKAKFKSFEQKRQLAAEYDVVLADDRIVTFLPDLLGKPFYKASAKRPVPVCLTGKEKHTTLPEGKRRPKDTPKLVGGVAEIARDIEAALNAALVHLSPSTSTAIKIGFASWTPEKLGQNIEALVPALVERCVPKKWNNVKSVHIKGPETAALPIYMSEELWVDEGDVRDEKYVAPVKESKKKLRGGNKRPLLEGAKTAEEGGEAEKAVAAIEDKKAAKKEKKRKAEEAEGADLEKEIAARKAKLKKQKKEAMGKGGVDL